MALTGLGGPSAYTVNYTAPSYAAPTLANAPAPIYLQAGGKASDMTARLTRAQWDDYKLRFQPIERQLMQETSYMNPGVVTEQVGSAVTRANRSFDVTRQNHIRGLGRYGITMDPEQQKVFDRLDNLNRSLAVSDAADRTRMMISDRNRAIALGGIPNVGRNYGSTGG